MDVSSPQCMVSFDVLPLLSWLGRQTGRWRCLNKNMIVFIIIVVGDVLTLRGAHEQVGVKRIAR